MERRLHEPPLRAPQGAVAGRQALAEQGAHLRAEPTLTVIGRMSLQHMCDMLWMAEQVDTDGAEGQRHNVAIGAHHGAQEAEIVAPHLGQDAEPGIPPRSWWDRVRALTCGPWPLHECHDHHSSKGRNALRNSPPVVHLTRRPEGTLDVTT